MTNEAADILRKAKERFVASNIVAALEVLGLELEGAASELKAECRNLLLDAMTEEGGGGSALLSREQKTRAFDRAIALAEPGQ